LPVSENIHTFLNRKFIYQADGQQLVAQAAAFQLGFDIRSNLTKLAVSFSCRFTKKNMTQFDNSATAKRSD